MADNQTSSDDSKIVLVTKEGLKKLQEELEYLKNVKRREIAERLKEAISYGDLSENSEYEEAKNFQAQIEVQILDLEEKVRYAKVIEEKHKVASVQLGTKVTLKDLRNKKVDSLVYTIVGSTEADPFVGKISNESPVGRSLLEKKVGDVVKIQVPTGLKEYEILKIE